MSFYSEVPLKAIRKARPCDGCGVKIEVGEPALACAGKHDDFWSATYHNDCRAAELALNNIHGCWGGDDWMNLGSDMDWDDWPWLIAEHPTVAARMNITTERFNEIEAEQARCRAAFSAPARAVAKE